MGKLQTTVLLLEYKWTEAHSKCFNCSLDICVGMVYVFAKLSHQFKFDSDHIISKLIICTL